MPRRRLPFLTAVLCGAALCAQTPTDKLRFDSTGSVTQRRILPPEPQERIDWEARVTALLKEEPGDIVITAVGDMIFNEQLSTRTEPCFRQLFRIFREADVAYGNLEFSMNRHPEAKRTFGLRVKSRKRLNSMPASSRLGSVPRPKASISPAPRAPEPVTSAVARIE